MATYTCPDGHTSQSADYCDVCGLPIRSGTTPAAAAAPAGSPVTPPPLPDAGGGAVAHTSPLTIGRADVAGATAGVRSCPNCGTDNPPGALFCENCGYDFTTGQLPQPLPPPDVAAELAAAHPVPPPAAPDGAVDWVAEVWVDPDWYAAQGVTDQLPSVGAPVVVPLAERTLLIGRTSTSRNIHPQIDVSGDNGVSRRHAQLTTDGQRWWIEDLQSSNGTFIGAAGQALPTTPTVPGQRVELAEDDRVYIGAWTRIVVRKA
ncbi:MAG TPA: FHA domain-containing protein [Kineosporiaceae bacterium]|nr:FHA domain-containing protein [Kineosporiaceae bacterium]